MLRQTPEEKKMKKLAVILLATVLVAGCVDGKFVKRSTTNSCGGTGWTHTAIHYGDSRIIVIPLSDVIEGEEMRFFLLPQLRGREAKDYQGATIRVTSKPADAWFDTGSGKFTDAPIISTCVKNNIPTGTEFEYKVEVIMPAETPPLKALLDPRAIVIDRD